MTEIKPRYGMVIQSEWSGLDATTYMLVAPGSNFAGDGWTFVVLHQSETVGPIGGLLLRFPVNHGWQVVEE